MKTCYARVRNSAPAGAPVVITYVVVTFYYGPADGAPPRPPTRREQPVRLIPGDTAYFYAEEDECVKRVYAAVTFSVNGQEVMKDASALPDYPEWCLWGVELAPEPPPDAAVQPAGSAGPGADRWHTALLVNAGERRPGAQDGDRPTDTAGSAAPAGAAGGPAASPDLAAAVEVLGLGADVNAALHKRHLDTLAALAGRTFAEVVTAAKLRKDAVVSLAEACQRIGLKFKTPPA